MLKAPPVSLPASPIVVLTSLVQSGSPSGGSAAQVQSWASSLQTVASGIGSLRSPAGAPDFSAAVSSASSNATTVLADLASSTTTPTQLNQDIAGMVRSANTLLSSVLAALVVADVSANGCAGYDAAKVRTLQTQDVIAVTGVYDAATVADIQALFPSVTIPAACGAAAPPPTSGGGGTTPPPTTVNPTPPATSSGFGVIAAIVVGAGAIASAVYLSQRAKSAQSVQSIRKKKAA